MKHFLFPLFFICCTSLLLAQKPMIDSLAVVHWPSLSHDVAISSDGSHLMYTIDNQPVGSQTLVVQKTDNSWKKEFIGASGGLFSADNKQAVFKSNDTLVFLLLGSKQSKYIPQISTYKQPMNSKGKWIAYQLKDAENELILQNLLTGNKQHFTSVTDYLLDKNEKTLLLKRAPIQDKYSTETLQWVDLSQNKAQTIWSATSSNKGTIIHRYCIDDDGLQLAFIVQTNNDQKTVNTIWYYKVGMDKAVIVANNQSTGIEPGYSIDNSAPFFSSNGKYIYFYSIRPIDIRKPKPDAVKVDIWSYRDSVLQSTQLFEHAKLTTGVKFLFVLNISNKNAIRLLHEDETLTELPTTKSDFVVIYDKNSISEYWWKSFAQKAAYLVSLKDGTRKLLDTGVSLFFYSISPNDKYVVYFKDGAYFSYNILSNKTLNISSTISTSLGYREEGNGILPGMPELPIGNTVWLDNGAALLIYDEYDIWQVDPSGTRGPVNITNGYGRKNNIKLRLVNEIASTGNSGKSPLLLTAFNTSNKYNGFYYISLGVKEDPELLIMGPYSIYITNSQANAGVIFKPLKASESSKWIIMRQSANDAPNLFFTADFKNYRRLTKLQPEKEYNWLTTELITWTQLNGTSSQGILYKPENFDPSKRYPIIFYYYEKLSQRMYEYPIPTFGRGAINIPWFVSRGYLVFTPDIHYTVGKTGESVYNTVVSAALYLSKMTWVDGSRMGINGHSFGGYETNYLVTHTDLFRAAATAAGPSNLFSYYGGLLGEMFAMESGQRFIETAQIRIGVTPWQRQDVYIMNSPIFKADHVTTPLLIMHNKGDAIVPWMQSVEFFTALRRLGKKVWMLQYDDGGHGVNGKEAVDFTIRITQFFDHYLKDSLPPKWMTKGIPATLKGIETRYELDTSGIIL